MLSTTGAGCVVTPLAKCPDYWLLRQTHRAGLQLLFCIVSQLETLGMMIGALLDPEAPMIDVAGWPPPT